MVDILTSESPCPTNKNETKATIRYTVDEIKTMGVTLIDPHQYATALKHWTFVANQRSSSDYVGTIEQRAEAHSWTYKWRLLKAGIFNLIDGDFEPCVPIPSYVERLAYFHDTGDLYGVYRLKQELVTTTDAKDAKDAKDTTACRGTAGSKDNKRVEKALVAMADPKKATSLGAIFHEANNHRFPDNLLWHTLDGEKCLSVVFEFSDRYGESSAFLPGYDHCRHCFLFKMEAMPTLVQLLVYQQDLTNACDSSAFQIQMKISLREN